MLFDGVLTVAEHAAQLIAIALTEEALLPWRHFRFD